MQRSIMQTIDTHQHFWKYHKDEYDWIGEKMIFIKKDFMPEDLEKEIKGSDVKGTIVVQVRQTLEETRWLLELSNQHDFIKGVIGWVDLLSDRMEDQLFEFTGHPKFVGVRHIIHDEPDVEFMLKKEFMRGISYLEDYGLTFDLLIYPEHLKTASELVRQFPNQKFVIDHLGKPKIRSKILEPWTTDIREFKDMENVYCKLSGMVTEADWYKWDQKDFEPYLNTVYQCFGPDRLMIGSDWPVCLLSGTYDNVMKIIFDFIGRLSAEDQEKIHRTNAEHFYGCKS